MIIAPAFGVKLPESSPSQMPEGGIEIAKGKLLIAMPTLLDPNFRQTVVLLCEHSAEGSLGLVINRPTDLDVDTVVDRELEIPESDPIFAGGPVGKNGMLVLGRGETPPGHHPILNDLFLIRDLTVLKSPGLLPASYQVRCFLGYAGWAAGQLEAEMASTAWQVVEADSSLVFDAASEAIWPEMMRRLGGEWAKYAEMPFDPSLN